MIIIEVHVSCCCDCCKVCWAKHSSLFVQTAGKEDKRAEQQQRNNDQTNMRRRGYNNVIQMFPHCQALFLLRGKSCNFLVFFVFIFFSRLTRNSRNYLLTAKIFIYPNGRRLTKQIFGYLGFEKKVATGLLVHIFEWNSYNNILYFGISNFVPMGYVTCLSNKNNGRLLNHLMITQPPTKKECVYIIKRRIVDYGVRLLYYRVVVGKLFHRLPRGNGRNCRKCPNTFHCVWFCFNWFQMCSNTPPMLRHLFWWLIWQKKKRMKCKKKEKKIPLWTIFRSVRHSSAGSKFKFTANFSYPSSAANKTRISSHKNTKKAERINLDIPWITKNTKLWTKCIDSKNLSSKMIDQIKSFFTKFSIFWREWNSTFYESLNLFLKKNKKNG